MKLKLQRAILLWHKLLSQFLLFLLELGDVITSPRELEVNQQNSAIGLNKEVSRMGIPMQESTAVKSAEGELASLVVLTIWMGAILEVLYEEADNPAPFANMTEEVGGDGHTLDRTVHFRLSGHSIHAIGRLSIIHQDKP